MSTTIYPTREEVARLIDYRAFYSDDTHGPSKATAFSKADAILALFPSPAPLDDGVRERVGERLARFLHDKVELPDKYVDFHWPEHPDDDGYRGEDGWVKIQPKDIVAHYREAGARAARHLEADLRTLLAVQGSSRDHAPAIGSALDGKDWEVEVRICGEQVLTIGSSGYLAGLSDIDQYGDTVRACAQSLASFIGDGEPTPCFACRDEGDEGGCPVCGAEPSSAEQVAGESSRDELNETAALKARLEELEGVARASVDALHQAEALYQRGVLNTPTDEVDATHAARRAILPRLIAALQPDAPAGGA